MYIALPARRPGTWGSTVTSAGDGSQCLLWCSRCGAVLGLNHSLGTPLPINGILCSAPAAYDKWPGIDFHLIDNFVNLFAEPQVGQEGGTSQLMSLARVTARGQQRLSSDARDPSGSLAVSPARYGTHREVGPGCRFSPELRWTPSSVTRIRSGTQFPPWGLCSTERVSL